MADKLKLVEEVKALEEKPLMLTKPQAQCLFAALSLSAFIMGSPVRKQLSILDPSLMIAIALVASCDPDAELSTDLTGRIAAIINPELGAEWIRVSNEVDNNG